MNSVGRQALAVILSGALVGLPLFAASPRSLIGVAQGSGAIQINGQPFEGHASLFSGDSILTGPAAPLTVIASSVERFRLEPNSSAQIAKQGQATLIRLDGGAVEFQTAGATTAELTNGISVRPAASELTMAMVDRLANGNTEISVYKGSVEVAAADEKTTVSAGHTALVSSASNAQNTDQDKNKKKKKAFAIFISTGLTAAVAGAILANEQSDPVSAVDP